MPQGVLPPSKDPFSYYHWTQEDPLFAMVLTPKHERILVGTKPGIIAQLVRSRTISGEVGLLDALNYESKCELSEPSTVRKFFTGLQAETTQKKREEAKIMKSRVQCPLIADQTYALGHFLLYFEKDPDKEWLDTIAELQNALTKNGKAAKRSEKLAKEFLQRKWNTCDLVCQYAALSIWRYYCFARETVLTAPDFLSLAENLVDAFGRNPDAQPRLESGKINSRNPILRLPPNPKLFENELRLLILEDSDVECVLLKQSFYPLKMYYATKLNAFKMKFCQCVVCGKFFVSETRKQKCCSELCANSRKKETKDSYEDKVRNTEIEQIAKRGGQTWYNRIHKAEKIEGFPPEQLNLMQEEFSKFKKMRKIKKIEVKRGELSAIEFNNWVFSQERRSQELIDQVLL